MVLEGQDLATRAEATLVKDHHVGRGAIRLEAAVRAGHVQEVGLAGPAGQVEYGRALEGRVDRKRANPTPMSRLPGSDRFSGTYSVPHSKSTRSPPGGVIVAASSTTSPAFREAGASALDSSARTRHAAPMITRVANSSTHGRKIGSIFITGTHPGDDMLVFNFNDVQIPSATTLRAQRLRRQTKLRELSSPSVAMGFSTRNASNGFSPSPIPRMRVHSFHPGGTNRPHCIRCGR